MNILIKAKKLKFQIQNNLIGSWILNRKVGTHNNISIEHHLHKVGEVDTPGISTANNNDKTDDGQDKKVRPEDTI